MKKLSAQIAIVNEREFFKESFKYYKTKNPPPNFTNVIDFDKEEKKNVILNLTNQFPTVPSAFHCNLCKKLGLHCHSTWQIFSIQNKPGFMVIKNPFCADGQQLWIMKSLQHYPCKPSLKNLDDFDDNIDDVWSLRDHEDPQKRNYLNKLSWVTMGYHHNWKTKIYSEDRKSQFPICLKELSQHVAHCIGFKNYDPQAAIINYYGLKSTLGIHDDHSEVNYDAPLISFSFGQTCVYLLGTEIRQEKPLALFLRSGDIVVMSGVSRLAYHAVPLIFQEDLSNRYCTKENNKTWQPFLEYICQKRINISVRQVF